jgi:nucleoid-associated protein YgaU
MAKAPPKSNKKKKAPGRPAPKPHQPDVVSRNFTITSEADGTKFTCTFADGSPIVVEGYAGWQVINRPRDIGIVEWQGRNPMAIEIPFIIDYWRSGSDTPGIHCEAQVARLEKLCGVGSRTQPPICKVDGDGVIPHDYSIWTQGRWIVENVTWDRSLELRNNVTGRRLRCGGTIQIRQFIIPRDILRTITSKSTAYKPKVYIVKKGDTLNKIAKWFYKDPSKWKVIADANHLRDRRTLRVGKRLKIPRA